MINWTRIRSPSWCNRIKIGSDFRKGRASKRSDFNQIESWRGRLSAVDIHCCTRYTYLYRDMARPYTFSSKNLLYKLSLSLMFFPLLCNCDMMLIFKVTSLYTRRQFLRRANLTPLTTEIWISCYIQGMRFQIFVFMLRQTFILYKFIGLACNDFM